MAGMFYSFEETAERLNIKPEQVRELVEQRKLREFRDGNKVLFKVSEVESLMSDTGLISAESPVDESETSPEDLGLVIADDTRQQPEEEISLETDFGIEAEEEQAEGEEVSLETDFGIGSEEEQLQEATEDDDSEKTELSLSLDDEGGSTKGLEISGEDTATTQEGINVLDQADSELNLTEDTQAETKALEEASTLEDIESDINLDSFGSGSGLLDLSLQADDTSLGGILDEIYTPEGGEGEIRPEATAADVAAEAEQILTDEQAAVSSAFVQGYIEPEPDMSSNVFGFVLLIPVAVVIYTIIVTIAGQFNILPTLVPKGMMVIYVLGGVLFAALILSLYGYTAGAPAQPKKAKPKKEKPPKPKKEKKPKEQKPKKKK